MKRPRLTFIGGAGKIGSAIIDGILAAKFVSAGQLTVTARHAESLAAFRKRKIACTTNNVAAVKNAQLIVLCVHPDDMPDLLKDIGKHLKSSQVLISIVSGCSTQQIETWCGRPLRIVRAMPNTPVHVRLAMTCLSAGQHAKPEDLATAQGIFATVGEVEVLDERYMNAATGLGGCGPAFAFKIIEALSEGGIKVGLPRSTARKMAAQVLKGAAELVLTTGQHPAALKDAVTTPGGCTIDGLAKLEERGLSIALIDAVETATKKAGGLVPGK